MQKGLMTYYNGTEGSSEFMVYSADSEKSVATMDSSSDVDLSDASIMYKESTGPLASTEEIVLPACPLRRKENLLFYDIFKTCALYFS